MKLKGDEARPLSITLNGTQVRVWKFRNSTKWNWKLALQGDQDQWIVQDSGISSSKNSARAAAVKAQGKLVAELRKELLDALAEKYPKMSKEDLDKQVEIIKNEDI